ncbi:hypothetical protein DEU56DRAFT_945936 [Suillus clintonianus]|uniref:uncharacterized protein n=1 Tax=Suillus clintonianus TaxID=1904413 RepID=UPI001B85C0CF|nr:uncharacterized protein DEU56DRAFT_945936 [Suillus clintonianus]KAG2137470.1 hypothetical protein DEU56DRAFT_945936 [Suillus clintonianus]
MLEAFKIREFNLEPIYESWDNPPRFYGESKKDMPVDDFLRQIKAGCAERKVPEEYWHKVAQHYMGDKAKARLQELKSVMAKVNGGKYRWSWKKFSIAMRNMGWEIDANITETVQLHSKPSGMLWLTRRKSTKDKDGSHKEVTSSEIVELQPPLPSKQGRPSPMKMLSDSALVAAAAMRPRRSPSRANSMASTLTTTTVSSNHSVSSNHTVTSDHALTSNNAVTALSPPSADGTVTAISNAPTWLLNACNALNFLSAEHPRAMTTLSAVLITAGTLPAIPAISGGTVLATGVAQAVGAIAVGVGNLLKAQQEGQVQQPSGPHPQPPIRSSTF